MEDYAINRITGFATDKLKFTSTGVCPSCQECADIFDVTLDKLQVQCENGDIFYDQIPEEGIMGDLIGGAINKIDWYEHAEHLIDEMELEEEEDY